MQPTSDDPRRRWRCCWPDAARPSPTWTAAKAFLDTEISDLSTLTARAAGSRDAVVHRRRQAVRRHGDQGRLRDDHDARIRSRRCWHPAFTAITGIKITHDLIGEGDVVEKLQTQMQSGENIYDAYVNDSDLIGTHWRYQQARNLTDWMADEGKDVTIPTLDLDDFIGLKLHHRRRTASSTSCPTSSSRTSTGSATTGSTTRRTRPTSRPSTATTSACRSTGRPTRTSPSSSPAARSTAKKVYGHMDYGKKDPSLGWRFTDAWLSMAGNGDKGIPNGLPVDEWGIRVDENSQPGRLLRRARRRHQRPGGGLFHRRSISTG